MKKYEYKFVEIPRKKVLKSGQEIPLKNVRG